MKKFTVQCDGYQITASLEELFRLGLESHILKMKEYFKIGNIILSSYWQKYDIVLEFRVIQYSVPYSLSWEVLVAEFDPILDKIIGEERIHMTHPDKNDKVIKRYERLIGA